MTADLDRWRKIAERRAITRTTLTGEHLETVLSLKAATQAIAEAVAEERAHFNAALKRIHRMAEIGESGICAVATEATADREGR